MCCLKRARSCTLVPVCVSLSVRFSAKWGTSVQIDNVTVIRALTGDMYAWNALMQPIGLLRGSHVNLGAICYRLVSFRALTSSIFVGTVAKVLVDQRCVVAAVSPGLQTMKSSRSL